MKLFYNLGVLAYGLAIRLAMPLSAKAKLWVKGRARIFEKLSQAFRSNNKKVVWFHVSSLGEFEQGRPVIENFKKLFPQYQILLTFFSPSGYEIKKNYSQADFIFYLPLDTHKNAIKFLEIVKPEMAFFVKYDFWYHYLYQLHQRKIPTYVFSAIFRQNQVFFKPYGGWYRKMLNYFSVIYVQNKPSKKLLANFGIHHVEVGGDTRFDRVMEISNQDFSDEIIEEFCQNRQVIVVGSSWDKDEELIALYQQKNQYVKWIIAPHEIHEQHLQRIEKNLPLKSIRYTEAANKNLEDIHVLIINTIGMLSGIYRYGMAAYIGGGFGAGIHNTLEAIVYGIPVVFGPNYKKFQEAKDILQLKAGFTVKNYTAFETVFNQLLNDPDLTKKMGDAAAKYVASMQGGTQKILTKLTHQS